MKPIHKNNPITFSPLIIGVMRLGVWGANLDTKALEGFIEQCIDLGLKDFDHADIYGHYTSEGEFGTVLKRRPDLKDKVRITTKCSIKLVCDNRPDNALQSYDSSAAHIISSAENSLKELNIECIDLLLLHRPDYLMNPYEIAPAFEQLRTQGKVKHFGVSNYTTSQFELLNSFTPLVNNQIEVSALHLNAFDDGTLNQCMQHSITPTAWSPLGGGQFFGKSENPKVIRLQKAVGILAEKYNASLDQILLAWLLKHPSGIIPVLGTSKVSRIETALGALKINLTHQEWYAVWEASVGSPVP